MTEAELATRHRHRGARPFQRYGVCGRCGRVRDERERPVWVTGSRRRPLLCLDCFDSSSRGRRAA